MAAATLLTACGGDLAAERGVLRYVDPYIGTAGHGHTFLGVSAPFGAVQLGPSNFYKGWDWSSGYHHSDSIVMGFAHLHLNGTGCSDTGDLIFMPYTGEIRIHPGSQEHPESGYASHYSHERETARPGYYALVLDDTDVKVELTATERVGFHRYTYPEGVREHVAINLKDATGNDRALDACLEQIDERTLFGYRISSGWAREQRIYFAARFSEPVTLALFDDTMRVEGSRLQSAGTRGDVTPVDPCGSLMVKVGVSPVSPEKALANILAELPDWDFEQTVAETNAAWERELAKVAIKSNDESAKRTFYTALYHAFLQPSLFNDCDGAYRGADMAVCESADFANHTVFSLWDTYRAAHPLYTILQPERVADFVNSFLSIYDRTGCLPVWHLYGSETGEMIGIQSVPVIADAILKGIGGFDYEHAFEAMKASMLSDYKGLAYLKEGDYIPADLERESVAKGLEYAIADWGIARVAERLGYDTDQAYFGRRACNYREYWDPSTGFFRGKNSDGSWLEPFDPYRSTHRNDAYCEGTAWQYIWLVPHDVAGLVALFGCEASFSEKLDRLFVTSGDMGEETSPDISGLIGQYAHGNEPGHHTAYLYAFVGQQWKTAERVRQILEIMYSDRPDGYQGNEDCGQMSSWYVLSSLGFYPVNPSAGLYVFGSPLFDEASIEVGEDRKFVVRTLGNSSRNRYIASVTLNGEPYTKSYITHADLMAGGELVFEMGSAPNKAFGADIADRP